MLKSVKGNAHHFYTVLLLFILCIVKEHQTPPSKNVPHTYTINNKHLQFDDDSRLSKSSEKNLTSNHTEKWRHYVTKTGRLTGYLIKTRNSLSPSKNERKEVWKPAFSLNTTSSLNTNYPSLNQSATGEVDSYDKTRIMNNANVDDKTFEQLKGWLVAIQQSDSTLVILFYTTEEEYDDSYDGLAVSPTSVYSPVKKNVTNAEVMEDERKRLQR